MAVNDQPRMRELEEMMCFCSNFKEIYVYGCSGKELLIVKYLRLCGVNFKGFIATRKDKSVEDQKEYPVYLIDEMSNINKKDIGVIIALPEKHYNDIIGRLFKNGFENIYFISEWNKRTIAHKMEPRKKEDFWLEVNLADHCNLDCQMCDHFSPVASEVFLDVEEFRRDMKRLAELTDNHIGILKLQGGEPLLHENVNEFIKITREYFPRTRIFLFTNGVFLLKKEHDKNGNLWQCCKENNVEIQLTIYPINLDFEAIKNKAKEYGVTLACFTNVADRNPNGIKFSVKHPFDLTGNQEKFRFISCYQLNESIAMKDGKIYTCPMIPYVNHFNDYFKQELKVTEEDFIDIYKVKNYEEIAEFVAKRVPFCGYCDVKNRTAHQWRRSEKSICEWS